jgi:hypothetical protein
VDCRDPKDNKYLELALTSGAATIVSSDGDLLDLDRWVRGVPFSLYQAAGGGVPPHGRRFWAAPATSAATVRLLE